VTGEKHAFTEASEFNSWLDRTVILVGHNFIAYDLVMLNRFWKSGIGINRVVDTFVLSQLYNPNYHGGHSLEAWGHRLRHPKTKHEDFTCLTPEMLEYCANDTTLTGRLFRLLTQRMRQFKFMESGAELEHLAWNIIQNKQRRNGFPFNKLKAEELYVTLRKREDELKQDIHRLWPPRLLPVREYSKGRKRDGSLSANYCRHKGQYPKLEWWSSSDTETRYRAYDWVEFNLGSPSQRVTKLLELGWKPTQFTKKTDKGGGGNPKVDEDSLTAYAEVSGRDEVVKLAKWIVINSRANMVGTWLDAYDEKTHAIHGKLFIASTLRYKHSNPNSANIPAVRTDKEGNIKYGEEGNYTYEARDLFTSGRPGWSLVGIDGTGIQNRCLIHNLINAVGEDVVAPFTELSLKGDIHRHNIEVLGLANKAAAKKFYYTLMMGGGGERLAADQAQFGTHMTAAEGAAKKTMLIKSIPGFHVLIKKLVRELEDTGRIKLCDGTPILVPSPHMVIPYLLQGDESRLMKKAMILVDEAVRRMGLSEYVRKVADIHDEWQYIVKDEVVDDFTSLALPCFPRAGEYFNYRIIIEGDAKVGKTWAETH
jgi:DNA polymerase-1